TLRASSTRRFSLLAFRQKSCGLCKVYWWAIPNIDVNTLGIFLGTFVYLAMLEKIAINIVSPEPMRDISGIYEAIILRRQIKTRPT
ncbi:MAG: hypothetical protein FWF77_01000, partial [Defluviitaleaceae bacterium]|nr:hypothetical protein [Defluviitaleaceae bacterium]